MSGCCPICCGLTCRTPAKSILYVNDGSSPCDEASWRQLPAPARGAGASHTFDSTPAFVYAHSFEGTDQVGSALLSRHLGIVIAGVTA